MSSDQYYIHFDQYISAFWPYDTLSLASSSDLANIWIGLPRY